MNLVGPGDLDEHFEDVRLAMGGMSPRGRWVDLGSGAGFPGLVMAAMFPELHVDLVDSRRKRCAFLERVLTEAEVPPERVAVRCQRLETLPAATYDGVTARALAAPDQVLDHAFGLLDPDGQGQVVLFLQDAAEVPEDPRFETFHVERYTVAGKARKSVGLTRIR